LANKSREGDRPVGLPLLVLIVSYILFRICAEAVRGTALAALERSIASTHLRDVIDDDNVLVGVLVRLVDNRLYGGSIVLSGHVDGGVCVVVVVVVR
jgi:hypothetical protein